MSGMSAVVTTEAIKPGLSSDDLATLLTGRFAVTRDPRGQNGVTLLVPAVKLREVVTALRDDQALRFTTLVDVVGIDYLSFPDHRGPRFAVVYVLKSLVFKHRLTLKVEVEEDKPAVPSIHDLFKSADWAERETWDQLGVVFTGHPNLKRLLNHHEFIGHPLRKDYPCQKRQKLSLNDPMIDQLEARLTALGYSVLDRGEMVVGQPLTLLTRPERTGSGSSSSSRSKLKSPGAKPPETKPLGAKP